jgi:octaprenyl-diphosphate synthase
MLGAGTNAGQSVLIGETRISPDKDQLWRRAVEPVESFLESVARRLSAQVDSFDPEVAVHARYALTSQGKQLRSTLVGLSAGAAGRIDDSVITVAAIIEMVHLATLVHDDIMDEASLRRRRPTLAANWGNQISVLVGDCLFAHALKLAAGFPKPDICRAVSAATKTVCSGEILQTLRRQDKAMTRDEYFRILQMKTAELFALSCDLGAVQGGGTEPHRAALRRFGLDLGIAYQVYDDCLDLFGTEAAAGKSLGTDLACGKVTLPVLVVLESATEETAGEIRRWLGHWDGKHEADLQHLLTQHDALAESQSVIQRFLDSSGKALVRLPPSPSRDALSDLTRFLSQQTSRLGV